MKKKRDPKRLGELKSLVDRNEGRIEIKNEDELRELGGLIYEREGIRTIVDLQSSGLPSQAVDGRSRHQKNTVREHRGTDLKIVARISFIGFVIFCVVALVYFLSSYIGTLPQSTTNRVGAILAIAIVILILGWDNWCRHDWVYLEGPGCDYRFCVKCHVLQDDGAWWWYSPNRQPPTPDSIISETKKLKEQHKRKYSAWCYITLFLIFIEICIFLSKYL